MIPLPLITKINSQWLIFFLAISDLPVCSSSHPQWELLVDPSPFFLLYTHDLQLPVGSFAETIKTSLSLAVGGRMVDAVALAWQQLLCWCMSSSLLAALAAGFFVWLDVTEYFSIKMNNKFCVKWEWLQAVEFGTELLFRIVYKCFNTLCYHNPYTVQTHMHKLYFRLSLVFSSTCWSGRSAL